MVDLDEIRKNAREQGIDLCYVAIFYSGLDESEIRILEGMNLIVSKSAGSVVGRFQANGDVLFPDKVDGVHYLGA